MVEVRSEGARTFLYLLRGELVFAEEESIGESLGRMLVRQEKLTEQQYLTVLKRMTDALIDNEQLRFGEVAIELGFLTRDEVVRALGDQVRWKIIRTLEREDYEWTFAESTGQVEGTPQFVLHLEPLVLEAARWVPEERKQRTIGLVARDRALTLREPVPAVVQRYQMTPDERTFVANIDGRRTIEQLVEIARGNEDASAVLTALVVTKGIAYVAARPAPTPAVPTPAAAFRPEPAGAPPLSDRSPPSSPMRPATPPVAATPPGAAASASTPDAPPAQPHRGLVPTPAQFMPFKGPVPDTNAEKEAAKEKADRALALLRAQRMGKPAAAPGTAVTSGSVVTDVATPTGAWKPVGAAPAGAPAAAAPMSEHEARLNAEQEFQRGKALLFQGQTRLAKGNFDRARKLQPTSTEYELFASWAEFVLGVANVDEARGKLKRISNAAVKADPNLAFGYYVLGEMALLDKNEAVAKKAFTHALKLDPKLVDAQRRLRLLKK